MPWRLVPRRSKPYLASAFAAASPRARRTAAAQTALSRAPFLPLALPYPLTPFPPILRMRVSSRRVSPRPTGHAARHPLCVLKTSSPYERGVYLPLSLFSIFPETPLPIAPHEVPHIRKVVVKTLRGREDGTHFAPGLFLRGACTNANVHGTFTATHTPSLSLFLPHSRTTPTAIKDLLRAIVFLQVRGEPVIPQLHHQHSHRPRYQISFWNKTQIFRLKCEYIYMHFNKKIKKRSRKE